jgi:hypothetical protein
MMEATRAEAVPRRAARERIMVAAGAALLISGVILVIAILPAEYGVDPSGIGTRLGLTAMSDLQQRLEQFSATRAADAGGAATVIAQERPYEHETAEFTIEPGGFIEYKYRLDKGEALLYSWQATAPVNYELHAEPDGAPQGYAESFEKVNARGSASGTLTAPFSGIHGWYWENPNKAEVTVTLSSAGFYNIAHEFRKDRPPTTKVFPQ